MTIIFRNSMDMILPWTSLVVSTPIHFRDDRKFEISMLGGVSTITVKCSKFCNTFSRHRHLFFKFTLFLFNSQNLWMISDITQYPGQFWWRFHYGDNPWNSEDSPQKSGTSGHQRLKLITDIWWCEIANVFGSLT